MTTGSFADTVFSADEDKVFTYDGLKWQIKARYGSHETHLGETLLEFTGVDAAPIKMDIILLDQLGVDPMTEISALAEYIRAGTQDYLILGGHRYGTGKWMLTEASIAGKNYGGRGKLRHAVVSCTFMPVGSRTSTA